MVHVSPTKTRILTTEPIGFRPPICSRMYAELFKPQIVNLPPESSPRTPRGEVGFDWRRSCQRGRRRRRRIPPAGSLSPFAASRPEGVPWSRTEGSVGANRFSTDPCRRPAPRPRPVPCTKRVTRASAKCWQSSRQKKLSVGEAMILIAQPGGYLHRQSDGPPGFECLWKGYILFDAIRAYIG